MILRARGLFGMIAHELRTCGNQSRGKGLITRQFRRHLSAYIQLDPCVRLRSRRGSNRAARRRLIVPFNAGLRPTVIGNRIGRMRIAAARGRGHFQAQFRRLHRAGQTRHIKAQIRLAGEIRIAIGLAQQFHTGSIVAIGGDSADHMRIGLRRDMGTGRLRRDQITKGRFVATAIGGGDDIIIGLPRGRTGIHITAHLRLHRLQIGTVNGFAAIHCVTDRSGTVGPIQ